MLNRFFVRSTLPKIHARFFCDSPQLPIALQQRLNVLKNENKSRFERYNAGKYVLAKLPNHVEALLTMAQLGVGMVDRRLCLESCDKIKTLTKKDDILAAVSDIEDHWNKFVPEEAKQQFEEGKKMCDWVYDGIIPIGDYGQKISDSTIALQSEWAKVAKQARTSKSEAKRIGNLVSRLWSVHVGDIENVYRLSRNLTQLLVEGNLKMALENYAMSEQDKEVLKEGDFKDPATIQNILLDQQKTIQLIVDQSGFNPNAVIPITKDYLLGSHRIMTQNCRWVPKSDVVIPCGEFKYFPNSLRNGMGYIYLFCEPSKVDSEIDVFLEQLNEIESKKYDPLYIAAWLHCNFINIHPFADGNGRVVRLLVSAILMRYGMPPFVVTQENKNQYYNAIEDANGGQSLPDFVEYLQTRVHQVTQEIQKQM